MIYLLKKTLFAYNKLLAPSLFQNIYSILTYRLFLYQNFIISEIYILLWYIIRRIQSFQSIHFDIRQF